VYKTGVPPRRSYFISRGPRAAAGLLGGLFEATAAGFQEFREHLNDENLFTLGPDNGVVEGAVAASGRFFERLSRVSDEVYNELRSNRQAYAPAIDYDLLADKVAERLSGNKPGPARIITDPTKIT